MGWMFLGSNTGGGEIFHTLPDQHWGATQPPIQWVLDLSGGVNGWGMALTTHPQLAPRLKKE